MKEKGNLKTSIVVPAHNEEENIGLLINDLLKLKDIWDELIIVDDNSVDGTGKIAEEFSKKIDKIVVIHRKKRDNGMGFALRDGTRRAKGSIVVWVMGDRSDDLNTIPRIIEKMEQGYDMVIGSRYMRGGSSGTLSFDKALLSSGYTMLCRLIFGLKIHDITNAFRGFRKKIFEDIELESGNFAISPEFSIKAHLRGYKLGEVPTTYFDRRAGKSKFDVLKMGIRYASLFRYRFTK
jgi:dolichol-phosphate mannosyltransferase